MQVGEILGLWAAGLVAERWGYKKTMLGSLLFMNLVIFMMFFAQNLGASLLSFEPHSRAFGPGLRAILGIGVGQSLRFPAFPAWDETLALVRLLTVR